MLFLESFKNSFADPQLSAGLQAEDATYTRSRLAKLSELDGPPATHLTECGIFAATYAKDILHTFDRYAAGDFE